MSNEFEVETEMTVFALKRKYKLKEIAVAYRDRPEGSVSKLNTIQDGIKILKMIIRLYRIYR